MKTYNATHIGGNQYTVQCSDGEIRRIDLDGITIISEEDRKKLDDADSDDFGLITIAEGMSADADPFWEAAANEALNYSGFDVDFHIALNLED